MLIDEFSFSVTGKCSSEDSAGKLLQVSVESFGSQILAKEYNFPVVVIDMFDVLALESFHFVQHLTHEPLEHFKAGNTRS